MENLNETISEECDSENESHFETPNNNFESENESHFETPNNSWVYEGKHDLESIPIHCDRFLIDFNGFKSKEPSNVDKYINKYRKMAQEVNQDLLLELKNPYDSDLDVDLDFDIDFSGFKSNDGENLQNMLNENEEKEEKENPDLPPPLEDEIYNFSAHLSPSEHLQVKKAIQEEGQEGCSSWGHTHKKKAEEEERHLCQNIEDEHSNVHQNEETCSNYGHSYSEEIKSGTQKEFKCIKVNCPSVIIVYEDPNEDNQNDYLFSVKECKWHQ